MNIKVSILVFLISSFEMSSLFSADSGSDLVQTSNSKISEKNRTDKIKDLIRNNKLRIFLFFITALTIATGGTLIYKKIKNNKKVKPTLATEEEYKNLVDKMLKEQHKVDENCADIFNSYFLKVRGKKGVTIQNKGIPRDNFFRTLKASLALRTFNFNQPKTKAGTLNLPDTVIKKIPAIIESFLSLSPAEILQKSSQLESKNPNYKEDGVSKKYLLDALEAVKNINVIERRALSN